MSLGSDGLTEFNFDWPSLEQLEAMQLTKPLRMSAIRTRGKPDYLCEGMQLLFDNGTESPFVGAQTQVTRDTSRLFSNSGKAIRKVHCKRGQNYGEILCLDFEYEDGSVQSVFKSSDIFYGSN